MHHRPTYGYLLRSDLTAHRVTPLINVESTAITEAERQATRDFTANHPAADLPCDDHGDRKNA
ncbi:hypothetical protein OG264_38100 [Streptomyces xanthophaeus]|nr:hypothetical protein OG264_38100 [Streptomyces xanthophaeus]